MVTSQSLKLLTYFAKKNFNSFKEQISNIYAFLNVYHHLHQNHNNNNKMFLYIYPIFKHCIINIFYVYILIMKMFDV